MTERGSTTAESKVHVFGRQVTAERWISRLLIAAAVVYGVGAVLLMAAPMPLALVWALLAVAVGLVALACLVGAARAVRPTVGPIIADRWRRRHTRDEWAEYWEELMRRPVR